MAISIYNIKKWIKMLTGKSILHVEQNVGQLYSKDSIEGYYNDLTNKVLQDNDNIINTEELPKSYTENGDLVYFPVAIFQYALGAFDLFLKTNEYKYMSKFKQCLDWTLDNQSSNGSWNNFFYVYPDHPYGAMCQGEGASVLLRGYKLFNDKKYLSAAKNSIDYMLRNIEVGGTAIYKDDCLILLEYTHLAPVLNGWIFAIFGLWDYVIATKDNFYEKKLEMTINSLKKYLNKFDNGYWSLYDLSNNIASPFYHKLHIAQLSVLYELTDDNIFKLYSEKWLSYQSNIYNKTKAFIKKITQKIR